jgi:uncharacterized protein YjbI with pentapeptide repeats
VSRQAKQRKDAHAAPRVPARPKPPASLELATSPEHDLAHEATLRRLGFDEIDLSGQEADLARFEQCRFTRATLSGVRLSGASFVDCRVEHSDWSNLSCDRSHLMRVEVTASRLTGVHWIDGALRDVTFRECRMDLAVFRYTTFKDVAFVDCNLGRADFTHADLRGAHFTGCDLSGAQFAQANAQGARFTRCELVGLGSVASLQGSVISANDLAPLAHTLAAALGIVIAQE